jgi:superfamily II DNA or RNA helicase
MSNERMRNFIAGSPSFQSHFDAITVLGILYEFDAITRPEEVPKIEWKYLLFCASVFSRSPQAKFQQMALRIADTCLRCSEGDGSLTKGAALILDMMANQRAAGLAVKRRLLPADWSEKLPLPLMADLTRRHQEDVIDTANGQIPVNRFQKEFWTAILTAQQVSASAPTSAGKSFILREAIAETFRNHPQHRVAIIVPTRALIQEFADEINEDIASGKINGAVLHVLPLDDSLNFPGGHICVFTQERMHILLSRSLKIKFDLLVIDEAHKIGDGYRGVLLEQVIEEALVRKPDAQIIYACPFAENPEYLLDTSLDGASRPVNVEVTTVTQNLLFLDQVRLKPFMWNLSFVMSERIIPVGRLHLTRRAPNKSTRLTTCVLGLAINKNGNLIYANEPAQAERYAKQLMEGIKEERGRMIATDPKIKELIKLVKRTIHQNYLLVKTLPYGVAYHYGNMPLLLRTEIERLFKEDVIKFLVCTGTLIEGVNLPCRTIFLHSPTKGRGKNMDPLDFWNLAGRAGRWGIEFEGSIVCVDTRSWQVAPPRSRPKNRIVSEIRGSIADLQSIVKYAESGYNEKTSEDNPQFDYIISFLFHLIVRDGNIFLFENVGQPDLVKRLETILHLELEEFPMNHEFMFKHPGILPFFMKELLEFFESKSDENLADCLPIFPEDPDAAERYQQIFDIINRTLRPGWSKGELGIYRLKQLARLSVDWMRGHPLAVLISSREDLEKWKEDKGYVDKKKSLPSIIIAVMKDVEEYARYKIPKYLRAYIDVLSFVIEDRGMTNSLSGLKDLELWLEFGVSTRTQLAFMEIGLSRTSAIELMATGVSSDFAKEQALAWLIEDSDIESLDLPGAVINEIKTVIHRYKKTV